MITVTYRKKCLRLKHVWFAKQEELESLLTEKKTDLVFAHGVQMPPPDGLRPALLLSEQHSLIKTLYPDENAVYQTFGKHLRKFIQRSIHEGTQIRKVTGTDITDEILDGCCQLYNKMKADKNLPGTFNTALAKEYAEAGGLLVSQAIIGGAVVGFKASIVDDQNLRGWVSAFAFREEEFDAQVISRAHQLLEWETMRYCCQRGIGAYDFGGIDSFENPNGIDTFKMTFAREGQRVTYGNYLVGVSPMGRIAVLGYKLLRKIRK